MKIHRRRLWVLAATALIFAVACGWGSDEASPTATATGTASPGTASPSATPTSASPTPLVLTTPKAAAEHLYEAWKANDKATAALGASSGAVDSLFAKTWTANTYFYGGCTQPTAPSECQYNWASGAVIMKIDGNPTAGFRVTSVSFGSAG